MGRERRTLGGCSCPRNRNRTRRVLRARRRESETIWDDFALVRPSACEKSGHPDQMLVAVIEALALSVGLSWLASTRPTEPNVFPVSFMHALLSASCLGIAGLATRRGSPANRRFGLATASIALVGLLIAAVAVSSSHVYVD